MSYLPVALAMLCACVLHGVAQATCAGNGASCACGGKTCKLITAADANITNGVCLWNNLAGQTPDGNPALNAPNLNNFACTNEATTTTNLNSCASPTLAGGAYYGLVDAASNGTSVAANKAKTYYEHFNVALSRYNCEEQYSHWNCDDCRKAYARWACAMTMSACSQSPCGETKPCDNICFEVVRKCPVTLGFTCPTDNRDYAASGCNSMGIASGATSNQVVQASMLVVAAASVWQNL